ncbi:kelch repeat and BTB domain-containing protein 8-like [Ptychodera flava]|uniref:kelch repeat and BTB domain-containing protein 8-like n=1 Tax=Ptychodera flava TaxID=63121 RepID=UPI00396A5262
MSGNGTVVHKKRTVHKNHSDKILKNLLSFYQNKLLTDVVLVVESEEFACHKNVLAACSPYFEAMFTGGLCEAGMDRVELKEIDAGSMKAVLDYMYTSEVSLCEESVQGIVQASHMLQIEPLEDHCASYLERHLHASNCIGVYNLAVMLSHIGLRTAAWDFLNLNFKDVQKEEEFLQASSELMGKMLMSSALNVQSEEALYESLMSWYVYDSSAREVALWKNFQRLRLGFMKLTYLCQEVKTNPVIGRSADCVRYIEETIHGKSSPEAKVTDDSECSQANEKRLGMLSREVLVIASKSGIDKDARTLICLDPETCEYCTLPYPSRLLDTGANFLVSQGKEIYAASSHYEDKSFYYFNSLRKVWIEKASMLYSRTKFGFCYCNGGIYAVGGESDWEVLDSVERYDPLLDEWSYVASMPRDVMDISTASFKNSIYVFSGSRTMCYDTCTDTWEVDLPAMVYPRFCSGVTVYNDEIWIVGGEDDDSRKMHDVEVYNPANREWWHAREFFAPMKHYFPASLKDDLYVAVLSPGFHNNSHEPITDGSKDFTILKRYITDTVTDIASEDGEEFEYDIDDWETVGNSLLVTYPLKVEACFTAEVFFEKG